MNKTALALNGGNRTITSDNAEIFRWPIVTEEDFQAVNAVMADSGRSSGTDITIEFEKEWAAYNGVKYALGTCNGTAALACGLWALGVSAGDEIIAPSMTYWATCACAVQLGLQVKFADVSPENLCLDPADVERRIGPRTKVIIVVNYGGYPADWDKLRALAEKYGLKILEDNSHGHGAMYKGRMCGSFGDIAGASMMSCKSFAIGEAGMITTNDLDLYKRCIAYGHYERTQASKYNSSMVPMDLPDLAPYVGIPMGGCKHRMNQMCSAMGRVQLRHYPARIAEIDRAMNYFSDGLDQLPGLHAVRPPAGSGLTKGGWYMPLARYDADALGGLNLKTFIAALKAEGVPCSPIINRPLHQHPYFQQLDYFRTGTPASKLFVPPEEPGRPLPDLPVTNGVSERYFILPWFKKCDREGIDTYLAAFRKVTAQAGELREEPKA